MIPALGECHKELQVWRQLMKTWIQSTSYLNMKYTSLKRILKREIQILRKQCVDRYRYKHEKYIKAIAPWVGFSKRAFGSKRFACGPFPMNEFIFRKKVFSLFHLGSHLSSQEMYPCLPLQYEVQWYQYIHGNCTWGEDLVLNLFLWEYIWILHFPPKFTSANRIPHTSYSATAMTI